MEINRNRYTEKLISSYFLQQLLFCILYFAILILDDLLDDDLSKEVLIQTFLLYSFGFVFIEFNLQFLVKKYFLKGNVRNYILITFFSLILYCVLLLLCGNYIMHNIIFTQSATETFMYMLIQYLILIVISMLYHYNFKYITANRELYRLQIIQKEKQEAELMALKSQINPHFLFNTLNNIYSFSVRQNPNTPNLILKLSDLTSYVLYESDRETVLLKSEIEFIRNFIELEKIRVDEKVKINFDVNVEDESIQVAPLLFIPLVENIFNHGLHKQSENDFANISLVQNSNEILFTTDNTYSLEPTKAKKNKQGIGIKNLRKRLELIYPDHKLTTSNENGIYRVEMRIKL